MVKSWLIYVGAFALALGAAAMVYFAGFTALMTGAASGMAGFVGLVVLAPMAIALTVFGVSYGVFSGHKLSTEHWLIAAGLVFFSAFASFLLVVQDVLEELPATLLMIVTLFVGGRFLLKRAFLA